MKQQNSKKAEATRTRILDAALAVFQERGFEKATMRDVASAAEVAVGAAYYYFPSKDAIVMAFYERAQEDMSVAITEALSASRTFEQRIGAIIGSKLRYFQDYRQLLGALSAHADPQHPLSPFSEETKKIREGDISYFEAAVNDSKIKLPGSIKTYFPRLLWLYQMGVILFWVYDQSLEQSRTKVVLEKTLKMMVLGLRLAGLPLFRPVHRLSAELLAAAYGGK
jgi:AcrR family transcriptional regulator